MKSELRIAANAGDLSGESTTSVRAGFITARVGSGAAQIVGLVFDLEQ